MILLWIQKSIKELEKILKGFKEVYKNNFTFYSGGRKPSTPSPVVSYVTDSYEYILLPAVLKIA